MPHSIEQNPHLHRVRRILRIIAPQFRIFATEELKADESVLDLTSKTIEISEFSDELEAVAVILFHIGHLRLMGRPELSAHFASFEEVGEKRLIAKLAAQGSVADRLSADWAFKILTANWNITPALAKELIEKHVWDETEWREFYTC